MKMMLDFDGIFGAVVPMYVVIGLAYTAVRRWEIFSPEQCFGINRFLVDFAVPFLVTDLLSSNNPYTMNFSVIAADVIQKLTILVALVIWKRLSKNGSLEWVITLFSLATLPNTLLIGLPIIQSMYGENAGSLLVQIVIIQAVIWNNLLMAMYEYRAAKALIAQRFPENAGAIATVELTPDVRSLCGRPDPIEADAEVADDGKLHLVVRNNAFVYVESMEASDTISLRQHSRRYVDASYGFEVIDEYESSSPGETPSKSGDKEIDEGEQKETPPTNVVTKLILITVWRKLIRNPTTYATIVGLAWSLIAYSRLNLKMPLFVKGTLSLLSKTTVGIAMFSLGLFIGLQPRIWACSKSKLLMSTAFRCVVGPVVMAAASAAVGLRGVVFQASTVQAALPTAIICFVYSKQYNVHSEIFSTSVILTTAIVLPVTMGYNFLLRLIS